MNFTDKLKALQEQALSDPLLTTEQVCELMQTSPSSLYRLRRNGSGPAWIRLGGTIRYRHSSVLEYLAHAEAANT